MGKFMESLGKLVNMLAAVYIGEVVCMFFCQLYSQFDIVNVDLTCLWLQNGLMLMHMVNKLNFSVIYRIVVALCMLVEVWPSCSPEFVNVLTKMFMCTERGGGCFYIIYQIVPMCILKIIDRD